MEIGRFEKMGKHMYVFAHRCHVLSWDALSAVSSRVHWFGSRSVENRLGSTLGPACPTPGRERLDDESELASAPATYPSCFFPAADIERLVVRSWEDGIPGKYG